MADETTAYKNKLWNVPLIKQNSSKECWIVCYEMMYGYKKMVQSEVRTKLGDKGLDLDSRLMPTDYSKARDAVGLTSYSYGYMSESWDNFASLILKVGPLWCVGAFLTTSAGDPAAHCVVVSGIEGSDRLRINDPNYIYKFNDYDYMTWADWCKKIGKTSFTVQCFNS